MPTIKELEARIKELEELNRVMKKTLQELWDYGVVPNLNGKSAEDWYQVLRLVPARVRKSLSTRNGEHLPMPQNPVRPVETCAKVPYKRKKRKKAKPVVSRLKEGTKVHKIWTALTRAPKGLTSHQVHEVCNLENFDHTGQALCNMAQRGHVTSEKIPGGKTSKGSTVLYKAVV